MIYSITDIFSIRTEIIEEKDNDMNAFLDKLHSVLHKFEKSVFKTPDKRIFKAVLIQRKDIYKEFKIIDHVKDHHKTCVVKSRIKVILKYSFTELV